MASLAELPGVEKQQIIEEKKAIVSDLIENAYNLGGGIGSLSSAVLNLTARRELSGMDRSALEYIGSNFLMNPYTMDWRQGRTGYITSSGPHEVCPFSDMNLRVFDETDKAYKRVNATAAKLSLSEEDSRVEKMQPLILKAATLKLASMLALLQQLTYDARALGLKIKPDYKPSPLDKWEQEWEKIFGKPLPDISTLYQQARLALVTNASYGGKHAQHLLLIPQLPYLKAN